MPFDGSGEELPIYSAPFLARITARLLYNGQNQYAWTACEVNPMTGLAQEAASARSGTTTNAYAVELNNRQVNLPILVNLRLHVVTPAGPVFQFNALAPSNPSGPTTFPDDSTTTFPGTTVLCGAMLWCINVEPPLGSGPNGTGVYPLYTPQKTRPINYITTATGGNTLQGWSTRTGGGKKPEFEHLILVIINRGPDNLTIAHQAGNFSGSRFSTFTGADIKLPALGAAFCVYDPRPIPPDASPAVALDTMVWRVLFAATTGGAAKFDSISLPNTATGGILLGEGSAPVVATAPLTDGQILVGQTGANPKPLTITGDVKLDKTGNATVVGLQTRAIDSTAPTDGQFLKWVAATSKWTPSAGGGGTGTVTSVDMTVPAELTIAGNPITTAGTLALDKVTQAANKVWAGPTTGADAKPTFRLAVAADIPNLDAAKITTGQLALARGGTHADLSATGGANQVLKQTAAGADVSVALLAAADIPGLDASKIITGVFPAARLPATVANNVATNYTGTTTDAFATVFDVVNNAGLHGSVAVDNTGGAAQLNYRVTTTDMYGTVNVGAPQTLGALSLASFSCDQATTPTVNTFPPYKEIKLEIQSSVVSVSTTYSIWTSFVG